jgi:G3E family GTPase
MNEQQQYDASDSDSDSDDEPPMLVTLPPVPPPLSPSKVSIPLLNFGKLKDATEDQADGNNNSSSTPSTLVPLTIITGYLGSGKSTIINKILHSASHGLKIMVIENEIADGVNLGPEKTTLNQAQQQRMGIEGMILRSDPTASSSTPVPSSPSAEEPDYTILELPNGCICCTVKSLLLQSIEDTLRKQIAADPSNPKPFDHILIETSGLSDPTPLLQMFWGEVSSDYVRLDGVVSVLDASSFLSVVGAEDAGDEGWRQIAFGDRVLVNKVDRIANADNSEGESELKLLEEAIRGVNPRCEIRYTIRGKRIAEDSDETTMTKSGQDEWTKEDVSYLLSVRGYDDHDEENSEIDDGTTRLKDVEAYFENKDNGPPQALFCGFIDDNKASSPPAFSFASSAKKVKHTASITTLSLYVKGIVDKRRIERFIGSLVWKESLDEEDVETASPSAKGPTTHQQRKELEAVASSKNADLLDIYRIKAVFSIGFLEGSASEPDETTNPLGTGEYRSYRIDPFTGVHYSNVRFILQAVRDVFEVYPGGGNLDYAADDDEERGVKIVFIGRGLKGKEHELRDGIKSCLI